MASNIINISSAIMLMRADGIIYDLPQSSGPEKLNSTSKPKLKKSILLLLFLFHGISSLLFLSGNFDHFNLPCNGKSILNQLQTFFPHSLRLRQHAASLFLLWSFYFLCRLFWWLVLVVAAGVWSVDELVILWHDAHCFPDRLLLLVH